MQSYKINKESDLYNLIQEIESVRMEMHKKISESNSYLLNDDLIELSQKLDILIVKYLNKNDSK